LGTLRGGPPAAAGHREPCEGRGVPEELPRRGALLRCAAPFASGEEAYAHYAAAHREAATLNAEIGRLEKAAEELRPWGAFDVEATRKLAARGIVLRYFFTQRNTFDKQLAEWSERYTVSEVSRTDATVWFVVVAKPGEEVTLDTQDDEDPDDGHSRGGAPHRRSRRETPDPRR